MRTNVLRRADWRFLLPKPIEGSFNHLVLLGGTVSLAERIVEVGIAQRVSCEIPKERSADVVAILHKARVDLSDVSNCLVPNGVLYYEVNRRISSNLTFTSNRIKRNLRDVGLSPIGIYAIRPNFDACELYLPLEVPSTLKWYVTSVRPSITPLGRFFESLLRALTGLQSYRFALLAPYYAVTAIASPAQSTAPSVLGHCALPTEFQSTNLYPLVFTDAGNRVIMLPFTLDGTQPVAVFKIPKLPSFNARTENEQAVLAEVRARIDPKKRNSIPRPLGILRYGEITVGIESYAPGRSLVSSSGRWGAPMDQKINDLSIAASWLGDFHYRAMVRRPLWDASELSQWVEIPLATFSQRFDATASEQRFFERVRKWAYSLVGIPFPIVWQHRDFNVWNIFRVGDELTVIDWEGGRPGPALCDLLHFVTYWYYTVRHLRSDTDRLCGFREIFFEPERNGMITKIIREIIARYMERLEIDRGFLPLLLVYTWIELALRKYDQQKDLGEAVADARSGNSNIQYIGVLAEHAEQLFETTIS